MTAAGNEAATLPETIDGAAASGTGSTNNNSPSAVAPLQGASGEIVGSSDPGPAKSTGSSSGPARQAGANKRDIADVLERADLSLPGERERVAAEIRLIEDQRRQAAVARAQELGLPVRIKTPGGGVEEAAMLDHEGRLLYRTTDNLNAAISTAANLVQAAPYGLTGINVLVGVWDGGAVRPTHQEMTGRVAVRDGSANEDHGTHVGGTIIASGVSSSARGMATGARIDSYDWNSDFGEMGNAGARTAAETNKVLVSNHSYGFSSGWRYVNGGTPSRVWEWQGTGTTATATEQAFGRYDTNAREADATAVSAAFMTIFWSAGNDRSDNPSAGQTVALSRGGTSVVAYNASNHPGGDGVYRGGYENVAHYKVAKNVVTVGAVRDAVSGGVRATNNASMTSFSCWGPTDDGRVKPDLVANGDTLTSSGAASDTDYYASSGTSMASPNAAGTAVLVAQEYVRIFGQAMRSSTMRGLLIHTADDLDTPGPDYKTGWGLVNGKAAVDLVRDQSANPGRVRLSENLITSSSNNVTRSFVWDGLSPIKVTVCWTDPAGTSTTTSDLRTARLVNNLDLRVVGPDGTTNRPFVMPFVGTWTQASMSQPATTGVNNTDNVEQVYLASPPVQGTYQAVVTFQGALSGNQQHFSLLISGSGGLPEVVTGVTASALSSSSVRVSWPLAAGANSYKVFRNGTQVGTVSSGTTFTDTGLTPSTDYLYRVAASNAAGDAEPSSPVSVRTRDWIDDNPLALLVLSPTSAATSPASTFLFSGQAGAGLTNGITWSNALSGQTGVFSRARDWSHEIALVPGTNVVTFRSPYVLLQTNWAAWDDPYFAVANAGWTTGLNGGSGFGPWVLSATPGNSGHFIASWIYNTNLSVGGMQGFGLWAHSGGLATATRNFNSPMQVRSRFTILLDNNWIEENGASSVGFALTDANDNRRFAFYFRGGQANYRVDDATANRDTGIGYTDAGLVVGFELTDSTSYSLTVGTNTFSGTLAAGGEISRLVASNYSSGFSITGFGEYDFFLGAMNLQHVVDQSGVAEATAAGVYLAPLETKTDGLPDAWWNEHGIPAEDRLAAGDWDNDGLSNAMEYFTGLDPKADDAAQAVEQSSATGFVHLDYRRSKAAGGIGAEVQWSLALDGSAFWSGQGVTDSLLEDHEDHEWRRATVPWLSGDRTIFLRMDLTLE